MKKFLLMSATALSAVLALGLTQAQAAPIPAGASCAGNCGTDTANGVVTLSPLAGTTSYLYVSTSGGLTGAGQLPGVGGTNGSLLTTASFVAAAGAGLQFYFNYVTSDGAGYADYAFAQLLDSGNSVVATLFTARTVSSGNTSPGFGLPSNDSTLTPTTSPIIGGAPVWAELGAYSGTCYSSGCGYTGWIRADSTIAAAGAYSLTFGVTNFTDSIYDSGLAIDGVTVAGVEIIPSTVPEPASMALLGAGLVGVGLIRRRRRV